MNPPKLERKCETASFDPNEKKKKKMHVGQREKKLKKTFDNQIY